MEVERYNTEVYDRFVNVQVAKKYGLLENNEIDNWSDALQEFENYTSVQRMSQFARSSVAYIAGSVVKKLLDKKKPKIMSTECGFALLEPLDKVNELIDNLLIKVKSRGGLMMNSESVIKICLKVEQFFKNTLIQLNGLVPLEKNDPSVLCSKVISDLLQPPCLLFPDLDTHICDESNDAANHIYFLIKEVCKTFIEIRMYSATMNATEQIRGPKIRNHLTRQIIWAHQ